MATDTTTPDTTPSPPRRPLLENGDHLTRDEFERRYEAMPNLKKAELLEGVVYMPSPVRLDQHASPHADLITWLGTYRVSTPGVRVAADGTVRLDRENEPQPDAALFVEPGFGGQVKISADGYIEGAPDLVAEVASSTVSIALNLKLRVYLRNGVREYLVWRVLDQAIDWFVLRQGKYERLPLQAEGQYRSEVFPGLWLDPAALVRLDLPTAVQVLQKGLASPEHAAFVARLRQANSGTPG
jgi:Uma2 family endonuclease